MRVFVAENEKNLMELEGQLSRTAVALGGFDAMHKGHQAIIHRMVETAKTEGMTSVVYFFVNQSKEVLSGEKIPWVNTLEKRLAILEELGVDVAVAQWLTAEFLETSPEEFATNYLRKILDAKWVAAGFNYRFGKQGKGDIALLRRLGEDLGIRVCEVPCVTERGEAVSSTRIRHLIGEGNMEETGDCLGRAYTLSGTVVAGNHQGRELGVPTANIEFPENLLLPREGVYLTETKVDGVWIPSMTNVGGKPSVEKNHPGIETHLLDFTGDLYDREIEVRFHKKIRDIIRFEYLEELQEQLQKDKKAVREYFAK